MNRRKITPNLHMADIIDTWPETIPIFLGYQMICVGCYMSQFDTLADAMKIYGIPEGKILDQLNQIIQTDLDGDKE